MSLMHDKYFPDSLLKSASFILFNDNYTLIKALLRNLTLSNKGMFYLIFTLCPLVVLGRPVHS